VLKRKVEGFIRGHTLPIKQITLVITNMKVIHRIFAFLPTLLWTGIATMIGAAAVPVEGTPHRQMRSDRLHGNSDSAIHATMAAIVHGDGNECVETGSYNAFLHDSVSRLSQADFEAVGTLYFEHGIQFW